MPSAGRIDKEFMEYILNDRQKEAVFCTEGPLLILAGAGSGKTRVLVFRAAHLIEDMGVNPWNIMMVTFTNKAAREMRERIEDSVGFGAESMWVATFHSSCVRMLRRYAERLEKYDNAFTIYDTDDSLRVMKDVCKRLNIDTKVHREKGFLNFISGCKNELIGPDVYYQKYANDYNSRRNADVYFEYQRALEKNNAMDFDDLIMNTVKLLERDPEVREYYNNRFKYVMVDEYQDTNSAQFSLIRILSGGTGNLCVVGDDDQSIYRFRGANIANILNFEEYFDGVKVIRLEQNYRSKGNILAGASALIDNNVGRHKKTLWTTADAGDPICFRQFDTGYDEAIAVAKDIKKNLPKMKGYSDFAVLYRTNAQSRLFEESFVRENIPYKVVGGVNFYGRKEIKDILAYLKLLVNKNDSLAVSRVINVPRRGIGEASVAKAGIFAADTGITLFEAVERADEIPKIGAAAAKMKGFAALIGEIRDFSRSAGISELISYILDRTGYETMLREEEPESAADRLENISELLSKASDFEEAHASDEEPATLESFLEEVALVADIDDVEENADYVCLMTVHAAKGLEFPFVYMVGMEDGLFPSAMSINSEQHDEEIEEERRLCYVGMTRAKERLYMTCARVRIWRGETKYSKVSRFMKEIPDNILEGGKVEDGNLGTEEKEKQFKDTVHSLRAMKILKEKPVSDPARDFGGGKLPELNYGVGDRVRHIKFGEGTVKEIISGGKDYEVTVEFDGVGVKKMLSTFAKLKKV